jgi:hypothetical protein
MKRIGAVLPVIRDLQPRRSGLRIPQLELRQVAARGLLEHRQPILDGGRFAVVAGEVQIQRPGIGVIAHQPLQHADHLGALFVDGGGVEVVDLDKAFGPDGVRQRPLILAELAGAQHHHILDPLHRMGPHVAAENCWSRKTVSPSFRHSWNQSRQVMRLPVQLWKYSCAITASIRA